MVHQLDDQRSWQIKQHVHLERVGGCLVRCWRVRFADRSGCLGMVALFMLLVGCSLFVVDV